MTSLARPDPYATPVWSLRTAGAGDAEALLQMWAAAGAEPTSSDDRPSIEALIAHDPEAVVVAEADGELVGSVIAGFDGWRGNLYRLAVIPRLRRRGLALALVAEAERRLADRGIRRVNALVVTGHAHAVGFWEAAGYPLDERMSRHVKTLSGPAPGRPATPPTPPGPARRNP